MTEKKKTSRKQEKETTNWIENMHGEFCTTSAVCERWKMCCGAENKPNITNKPETEPKGEAHMLVIRAAVGPGQETDWARHRYDDDTVVCRSRCRSSHPPLICPILFIF